MRIMIIFINVICITVSFLHFQGTLTADKLEEIELLLQCLTIICRHFDNIPNVVKSSYISNCISISNGIFQRVRNMI